MKPTQMNTKVPLVRCSNENCLEELDTQDKLMTHMDKGQKHAPIFYAVKTGSLKQQYRDMVKTKFRSFLASNGLSLQVLERDENEFVAFVLHAVVTTTRMARSGSLNAPMSTDIIEGGTFETCESAEIALALECQGGAIFVELTNEHISVPNFLPELPITELYKIKR